MTELSPHTFAVDYGMNRDGSNGNHILIIGHQSAYRNDDRLALIWLTGTHKGTRDGAGKSFARKYDDVAGILDTPDKRQAAIDKLPILSKEEISELRDRIVEEKFVWENLLKPRMELGAENHPLKDFLA